MQTLKDAATLAALILLALTLRVDFDGNPMEIDLNTPAVASMTDAGPAPSKPIEPQPTQAQAEPAVTPVQACPKRLSAVAVPPQAAEHDIVHRRFVWEVDGKRIVIVLDGHETVPAAAASKPCDGPFDPKLSC
jgi:hypothetical protein